MPFGENENLRFCRRCFCAYFNNSLNNLDGINTYVYYTCFSPRLKRHEYLGFFHKIQIQTIAEIDNDFLCCFVLFLCESVVFALCGLFDNGTVNLGINSLVCTIQLAEYFFQCI